MCAAAFTYMIYTQRDDLGTLVAKSGYGTVPLSNDVVAETPAAPEEDTRADGGTLLWTFDLNEVDEPVSSPGLGDLNGDGKLEIVVASAGDAIYAINPDGQPYWMQPYTDDVIDYMGETSQTSGLDFTPPPIFSSVTVADIDMGTEPEIIVGVKDGALCLKANGDLHWKKGLTTGYYFSTCGITDLEGEWTGVKDDFEVIMASDDSSRNGWLEAWKVDGSSIFREEVTCGGEGGLIGCSVSCGDLDGSFADGAEPYEGDETDTELIIGNHDKGMRIWGRAGNQANGEPNYDETTNQMLAGHQTYATTAQGNFSDTPVYEIITASCEGYQVTWTGWGGKVYCYDPQGSLKWDFTTGSSQAAVLSSPSVADVQCAKDDPDEKELNYEVFFGCDNGKIYCLSADKHSELWSYDTGGRVMSSPAICNIDGDDELEVVIGSDSGKVYCFDGDPSDGEDDGQSVPGDSSAHDLLWVCDIGSPVGISSPVVGDINLDGQLEVVIGDAKGHVHAIAAGGRCVRGQLDWPEFHYDNNKTGFYNPQVSFGVDLTPRKDLTVNPPAIEQLMKTVEPGMSITYNITVRNTGKAFGAQAEDVIYLKVDGVPKGWSTYLDTPPDQGNPNPPYVRLMVDASTNITLKVTAPWEGEIGDLAQINITGNSSNDPWAYDTITTISMLNIFIDFDLEFTKQVDTDPASKYEGHKWEKISPGAEAVFAVTLTNLGNCNDTYELVISGVPEGWDAKFIDTMAMNASVRLMSSIFEDMYNDPVQTTLTVKVTCPVDATLDEEAWIKVTGTSQRSAFSTVELIEKSDELLLIAGSITDIKMGCDEPQKYISPASSVEFELEVENMSNNEITVLFNYDGLLEGWDIDLPEERDLLIGQKITISAVLTAPEDAPADLTCVMTIVGKIKGKTHLQAAVGLTAIVEHVYDFEVSITPPTKSVDPGKSLSFDVAVQNLGNGKDIISPSPYDINLGWNVSFMLQGFSISSIDLYYRGWANFSITMDVPKNTIANTYSVGINISGVEKYMVKYIVIVVNQTYNLKVLPYPFEADSDEPFKTEGVLDPGRIVPFMVEVRNEANGPEKCNITIEGIDNDWKAWFGAVANTPDYTRNVKYLNFDEELMVTNVGTDINYLPNSSTVYRMTLLLPTKQSAWFTVYIQAPVNALANSAHTISVIGDSKGGAKDLQEDNKASIDLTILYPDLAIDGIINVQGPNGPPNAGEIVTISVNIKNVGDIEAVNVVVSLKIDNKEVKRTVVKRVLTDKDQLITFSWKAEAGTHEVKIEIDPDDTIIETNDQNRNINNNVKKRDVTVGYTTTNVGEMLANPVVLSLFILLLVIAAVGIATMIYLKKKAGQ